MIRLAVCDDSVEDVKNIKEIIESYNKPNIEVDVFNNPMELLDKVQEYRYDAFFLDIDMPEMTGLQVSSKIREKDVYSEIIFITVREELVFESLTFKPFSFVRKRYLKEELDKALNALFKVLDTNNICIDETS